MYIKGILLILAVLVSVAAYGFIVVYMSATTEITTLEKFGQFGDSFGILASLFSGLAFSGLIITILLQKKELQLQREELSLTRGELEKSRVAQQEQVKQLENTAKLNAVCTLTQVYTDMSLQPQHATTKAAQIAAGDRDSYIEKIKGLLDEIV